jgi:hypothetical protein
MTMHDLEYFYFRKKDYDKMLKYHLMAIDNNNKKSINELNDNIINLPIILLSTILPYTKHLSKKSVLILNNKIET